MLPGSLTKQGKGCKTCEHTQLQGLLMKTKCSKGKGVDQCTCTKRFHQRNGRISNSYW